jgi:hypothetical protein
MRVQGRPSHQSLYLCAIEACEAAAVQNARRSSNQRSMPSDTVAALIEIRSNCNESSRRWDEWKCFLSSVPSKVCRSSSALPACARVTPIIHRYLLQSLAISNIDDSQSATPRKLSRRSHRAKPLRSSPSHHRPAARRRNITGQKYHEMRSLWRIALSTGHRTSLLQFRYDVQRTHIHACNQLIHITSFGVDCGRYRIPASGHRQGPVAPPLGSAPKNTDYCKTTVASQVRAFKLRPPFSTPLVKSQLFPINFEEIRKLTGPPFVLCHED